LQAFGHNPPETPFLATAFVLAYSQLAPFVLTH
jgi:hypothetical protein